MRWKGLAVIGALTLAITAQAHAQVSPLVNPSGWLGDPQAVAAAAAESATGSTELAKVANTLSTAISTAQEAIYTFQAMQAQVQALQSLSQGDWEGFVQAVDYETQAIGTVNAAWQSLPDMKAISPELATYVGSSDYQTASTTIGNLATNWANFDNVVQQTNGTIQDMKYRAQMAGRIMEESKEPQNDSPVSQLQLTTQELGLVEGDLQDMEDTTLAAKTYEDGLHAQAEAQAELDKKAYDNFEFGNSQFARSNYTPEQMQQMIGIKW